MDWTWTRGEVRQALAEPDLIAQCSNVSAILSEQLNRYSPARVPVRLSNGSENDGEV